MGQLWLKGLYGIKTALVWFLKGRLGTRASECRRTLGNKRSTPPGRTISERKKNVNFTSTKGAKFFWTMPDKMNIGTMFTWKEDTFNARIWAVGKSRNRLPICCLPEPMKIEICYWMWCYYFSNHAHTTTHSSGPGLTTSEKVLLQYRKEHPLTPTKQGTDDTC